MKGWLSSSILLVAVWTAFPDPISAQDFRDMELNLFVAGAAHTHNKFVYGFPQAIPDVNGEFRLDDSLRGGLRFNVNTTGHWGEEFFFSYEPNDANITRSGVTQDFDIRIYNFGLNVMYYLNEEGKTRPFVSFGIGGTVYQPTTEARQAARDPFQGNLPGFDTSAKFAFNYGIGFKRSLGNNYGFRMDLRGYVSPNPAFGLPRTSSIPTAVVFPNSGAIHDLEVSAGVLFKLNR